MMGHSDWAAFDWSLDMQVEEYYKKLHLNVCVYIYVYACVWVYIYIMDMHVCVCFFPLRSYMPYFELLKQINKSADHMVFSQFILNF